MAIARGLPIHDVTQAELLARLAREHGEREALVYPRLGVRMTFATLEAQSLALARGLVALGLEPGERVAIWAENVPEWIPLQFAAARAGLVLVTANTALARDEIAYLLRQSRSAAVVTSRGVRAREYMDALEYLSRYDGVLPDLRHAIAMRPDAGWQPTTMLERTSFLLARSAGVEPGATKLTLEELVERGRDVAVERVLEREARVLPDDPVNIQYTSGTTGFPKGVVLTNRNLVENAYAIGRRMGMRADDRLLLQVPLFHCFGCVVSVIGAYTHGVALVALERFDPLAALEAIAAERCTLAYGVPTMFLALLEHPERARFDTSSLRGGIMGGSMCPEPLMRRVVAELGAKGMLVAYGLTEASPGVTCSAQDDPIELRCGTVGTALDGVEVMIADPETGAELARGEAGELWTRGPNVMQGYFDDPRATAEAITPEGWLRTGDLATVDADGRVRIVGRIKELVIRGGENVYPAEVEDALRAHPDVRDAAVFGVPSERWGEEVAAAVVLRPGAREDAEAILASLEHRLAPFKHPTHVRFMSAFPLTASGKVQKFRLAEACGLAGAAADEARKMDGKDGERAP